MEKNNRKLSILSIVIGVVVLVIIAVIIIVVKMNSGYRLIKVESYEGEVELERKEKQTEIFEGMNLKSEDIITTGEESTVALWADSDKHIVASENTRFALVASGDENKGKIQISLEYGTSLFEIENKLPDGSEFEVNTPNATLSVRGTIFEVCYDKATNTTVLEVQDGIVEAVADSETRRVKTGEKAVVIDGEFADTVGRVDEIILKSESEKTIHMEAVSDEVMATLAKVPDSTITYIAVDGHGEPEGMGVPFQNYLVGVRATPYEGYRYLRSESETIEFHEYSYNEGLGYDVPWFFVPESGNHVIYVYYEAIE